MTAEVAEGVGLFLECFYHLFLPIVLLMGGFCFVKSVIRSTTFYEGKERLDGKTVVITGGANGLGRALAVELCRRGARVISACRTRLRRDSTAVYLREKTGSFNHRVMYMDLNNLESVRTFAQEIVDTEGRIDCLINNAGIICDRDFTADGLDRMLGINYVGHFLLTYLLCEKITSTPNSLGRVISITGGSFAKGSLDDLRDLEAKKKNAYDLRGMYRSSKLGLYLMSRELARRYSHFDICSFCVDPGLMNTDFYKNLPSPQNQLWSLIARCMFRTVEEGMQSVLYALLAQEIKASSGMVVKDCKLYGPKNCNWTDAVVEDIWIQTFGVLQNKGIDLELGSCEEAHFGASSEDVSQLHLERLTHLSKRSLTDDEEEGPQLMPRPATPPRSNKTVHDEGDEVVETVEFRSEEPPEVVRATPSRQSSVEKEKHKDKALTQQKSVIEVLKEILHEEEDASAGLLRVHANVPREPTPTLESLADENTPDTDTLKRMLEDEALFDVNEEFETTSKGRSLTQGNEVKPNSGLASASIVQDLATEIEMIQEMFQEEESADLQRIEAMLREEGTPVDDASPPDDEFIEENENIGKDIRHPREMSRVDQKAERLFRESSPALERGTDLQAPKDVLDYKEFGSNSPAAPESQGIQLPPSSLQSQAQSSAVSRAQNDRIKDFAFEYNYERRNSQMHNSLTDVKVFVDYLTYQCKA
ncbi:retinol dehydrogenase 14-like [Tropilaelaps mercedesae]|uniref:Retinol dehydrogenase 14-like n=1 Tax=Tropilaelaps mercedesae TaxID=418985 RepID=A0A1V9Y1M3_9ACAR|nr:retinol dehydrogenase 14-like [Tropilaelaps mercedesae]